TFKHLPELIKQIKEQGFEPAIWVAPFIAEADSAIFKEHPEYFVKDEEGNPLPSNQVTFGGWRRGPWYMLDATNPQAREHLKQTFRVMNQVWGIKYFKLDANMWGAMPFGERYDSSKTYVEAYRMGMKAILEGAGSESYILGCNAPMWPSIGVVHGMRISGDICRDWQSFKVLSEECFYRNWQHNRLWINDPDCIVLDNIDQVLIGPDGKERKSSSQITQGEFDYHRAHILVSGGAVLSGDAVVKLSKEHIQTLRQFLNLPDQAARFDDHTFTVGRQTQGKEQIISIFNRTDDEKVVNVDLKGKYDVMDYWQAIHYGEDMMDLTVTLQPHSAVVLRAIEKEY
ncbi:MAG: glycoside hydrolase family 36 protein, partial [Cellulosilyticaceae bacterium]